jgi:hypothetical protein
VLGGQQQHHPGGLADGHGRAHVGVEEQPLDGQRLGPVGGQHLPQPRRQGGQRGATWSPSVWMVP